jgi:hypothetical protein
MSGRSKSRSGNKSGVVGGGGWIKLYPQAQNPKARALIFYW